MKNKAMHVNKAMYVNRVMHGMCSSNAKHNNSLPYGIHLLGDRSAGVEWTDMKLRRGFNLSWLLMDTLELSFPLKAGAAAEWKLMRHAELGLFIPIRPV